MNPFGALADLNEPVDPTDVEFFKFTGLVPDAKVALQQHPFDIEKYPATVSLIACSNKHGYFAAATTEGFIFGSTKSLRKAFYSADKGATVTLDQDKISVPLANAIRQVRFSADELQLLIATEGRIVLVYNVSDINNSKGQAAPIHTFNLNHNIIDLRPNREALPNLAAVLFDNNQCKIIDITNGNTECDIPANNVSAICWSPKGKQIVCGKLDGGLQHFDAKGASKDALSIPEAMSAGHGEEQQNRYVQDVLWIENHIFLVLYARKRDTVDDEYVNDGYIINRKPAGGATDPEYIRLAEITPIFTTEGRGNHFYMEVIRDLGKEIKHLVIIANAATNELSVVGQNEEGDWATWMLPENGLANLPLSEETSMDTYPLGLALDFTADEKLPPFDASEDDIGVDPMPIFYYINDEGHIGSYHCYNSELARRGESYSAFSSAAAATAATASAPAAPVTQTSSSFSSAFGSAASSTGTSSFGDLLSGKSTSLPASTSSTSGFGSFGSFGAASSTSIPSFSSLGSAQKIPATPAAAGFTSSKPALDAAVPTFGSTTNIGFASTKPAFGASTTTTDKPLSAFGSTTATKPEQVVPLTTTPSGLFGSMSLGSTATSAPAAEAPKSTFGSFDSLAKPVTTSAFGSTPAVISAPTSAFGSTPTVTSAPTSLFGSTATATSASTSAFGSTSTVTSAPTTAFGSTSSTVGGFGSLAKSAAPASISTTRSSSFGSTSFLGSTDGFGSLAKNTVPGATAPTTTIPAFGSTATLGSGGFGSLAKNTVPGATAPTSTTPAFGSTSSIGSSTGGFGLLAKNTVPGATAPTTTPAFGSTATLGSSGGFDSLAKNTVPGATAPTTTPTFGSTATLGSGGFGSLVKNTVPGATAPTTTPTFGSTATLGSEGGFGSLAKNTVPGATAPKPATTFGSTSTLGSSGFGSLSQKTPIPTTTATTATTATTSTTVAPATTTTTISTGFGSLSKPAETKPTTTTTTTTTATTTGFGSLAKPAETKVTSKPLPSTTVKSPEPVSPLPKPAITTTTAASASEPTKEKLKPTAAEGMAREYESLYITVCEGIEKLSLIHKKINLVMEANTMNLGTKSEASLKDKKVEWNLNDVAEYAALTTSILANIEKDQASTTKMKESLQSLSINSKKSMDKKEDIKYLLQKEIDVKVVDLMDNCELDAETKEALNKIENKFEAYESTLEDLEFKVQEYKKRNKIKNDYDSGSLSLYSLHRAIRDIQRDIVARNNDLGELEERLANIKLNESRRKAQHVAGFSCDISDSEDEEEEEEEHISAAAIKHTTKYLRRFNFLNNLCDKANTRSPLQCPVE